MNMSVSRKKQAEFDNIFTLFEDNNFVLNVELFKKLFNSDFYEHFINHITNKISGIVSLGNNFKVHINISKFEMSDLCHYDKILKFADMLHSFTNNLLHIVIYESTNIFINLVKLLNSSIGIDITKKLILKTGEDYATLFTNKQIMTSSTFSDT